MIEVIVIILVVLAVLGVVAAGRSVRVVQQFEQGIVFRSARSRRRPAARD
jgi:regulator of protease activity HflC (stomatin/prohibitin superfamily)